MKKKCKIMILERKASRPFWLTHLFLSLSSFSFVDFFFRS